MEDNKIVELYWQRDEYAIVETKQKYGKLCYGIAHNILHNHEDAEECENDTYLGAWNSMPPHRPQQLSAFLGRITRRISINRFKQKTAQKRGGGETLLALDELHECIPDGSGIQEQIESEELAKIIDKFLRGLDAEERNIFLCRYWYFYSIKDICAKFGCSQSKIKMKLFRTREKLLVRLGEEGVFI